LNRYLYTANNPINAVDPTGNQAFVEYSEANQNAEEEGAVAEPVGEEFASEAKTLVDETDLLLRNAGHLGEDTTNLLNIKGSPAPGDWSDYVAPNRIEDVEAAFKYEPQAIKLDEPLTAYRYWSNPDLQVGHWLTLNPNLSPAEARALLALPNENLATHVTSFIIPKDVIVLIGTVAEQTTTVGFGTYAIGGGFQIYLPDLSVLIH